VIWTHPAVPRFSFPGTYRDEPGEDAIVWRVVESRGRSPPSWGPGFELQTTIRGVPCWGYDFDGLEPVDSGHPDRARLSLSEKSGELCECLLRRRAVHR
jgi:hypothetical protein